MITLCLISLGCALPQVNAPGPTAQQPPPEVRISINIDQPIPVGEEICTAGRQVLYYDDQKGDKRFYGTTNYYIYQGLDDKNNVKVLYKNSNSSVTEISTLLLPLNDKNHAILRVKTAEGSKKDLLITVADEFKRIAAEEYVENPAK